MNKRGYTHVKELLPSIQGMIADGMSQQEVADYYGFKDRNVVKELLRRSRRKEKQAPKSRGRKPAKTLQEYKYENKRLKMEVALLRDFLQSVERK